MRYSIASGSGGSKKVRELAIALSNYQCFNVASISSGINSGTGLGGSNFADMGFHLLPASDYGLSVMYTVRPTLILSGGLMTYKLRQRYCSSLSKQSLLINNFSYGADFNIQKEIINIKSKRIKLYWKFGINCIVDPTNRSKIFRTDLASADTIWHYYIHQGNYNTKRGVNFLYHFAFGLRKSLTSKMSISTFVGSTNGLRSLSTDQLMFVTDYTGVQPGKTQWASFTGQNRGDKVGLTISLEVKL
jgi:hypothetical protein